MTYGQESSDEPSTPAEGRDDHELEALLVFLHRDRGFDFSGHKRPGLIRRVRRRMSVVGIDSLPEYLAYLQQSPDELTQLFDLLLINVTAFFRDPPAWHALAARLPSIVDLRADTPIRVWSAGCSSGEEPYTLAMVLCETLGEEAFARRVKIFATDIDDEALAVARLATYSRAALEPVPEPLIAKYFTPSGDELTFNKELRREIVFGRHDLLQDAPIPHIDVLACRNALMYFNAETQERLLGRLHFALNPSGVLFLGKAEMLLSHSDLFAPVDLKLRLFARAPRMAIRAPRRPPPASTTAPADTPSQRDANEAARAKLRLTSSGAGPIAQIVVDAAGDLVSANERAARLFSISPRDVGRSVQELALVPRAGELAACIERARGELRAVQRKELERVHANGEKSFLDLDVTPLLSEAGSFVGAVMTFVDVTYACRLRVELRRASLELEAAHEELRATRREVQSMNEELQATNEELETTNEELRATNEELEATNEELQSTNEELQTINAELRQRGTELNETHALFGAVLGSLPVGIAVLDRELRVFAWNARMVEIFGVRPRDAEGKLFASLDIGLPVREIAAPLRAALEAKDESERTIDSKSPHGDTKSFRVRVSPLRGEHIRGVVVLVEEVG